MLKLNSPERIALIQKVKNHYDQIKEDGYHKNFLEALNFHNEIIDHLKNNNISLKEIGFKFEEDLFDILIKIEKENAVPKTFYRYAEELKQLTRLGKKPDKEQQNQINFINNALKTEKIQLPETSPFLLTNKELKNLLKRL